MKGIFQYSGIESFVRSGLLFFLISATLGMILRFIPEITNIPVNNQLHAHSHAGLLSVLYPVIFALSIIVFAEQKGRETYRQVYYIWLISSIGMVICFPLFGYTFPSILFSTLHLSGSIILYRKFETPKADKETPAYTELFQYGKAFFILSSLSLLLLPFSIRIFGRNSAVYHDVVYIFLHLVYNGWFMFTVLALLQKKYSLVKTKTDIIMLFWSTLSLTAQVPLWHTSALLFSLIAITGAVIQVIIFFRIFIHFSRIKGQAFIILISAVLTAKSVFLLAASIPNVSQEAYMLRSPVIGYLHFLFLGFFIPCLYHLLVNEKLIKETKSQILRLYQLGLFMMVCGLLVNLIPAFRNTPFFPWIMKAGHWIIYTAIFAGIFRQRTGLKRA